MVSAWAKKAVNPAALRGASLGYYSVRKRLDVLILPVKCSIGSAAITSSYLDLTQNRLEMDPD